jgi:hypothetical protein
MGVLVVFFAVLVYWDLWFLALNGVLYILIIYFVVYLIDNFFLFIKLLLFNTFRTYFNWIWIGIIEPIYLLKDVFFFFFWAITVAAYYSFWFGWVWRFFVVWVVVDCWESYEGNIFLPKSIFLRELQVFLWSQTQLRLKSWIYKLTTKLRTRTITIHLTMIQHWLQITRLVLR